jgi:hypothetical protein
LDLFVKYSCQRFDGIINIGRIFPKEHLDAEPNFFWQIAFDILTRQDVPKREPYVTLPDGPPAFFSMLDDLA